MPETLNINAYEVELTAGTGTVPGLLAGALHNIGKARATIESAKTGAHIALTLTCKSKANGRWEKCPMADADAVFVDQPLGGDAGSASVGTYYPTGKWAGRFFYSNGVDPARVWAATFLLKSVASRPVRDDQARLVPGGHCMVCGRELDVPESIERGMGPVCYGRATGDTAHVRSSGDMPEATAPEFTTSMGAGKPGPAPAAATNLNGLRDADRDDDGYDPNREPLTDAFMDRPTTDLRQATPMAPSGLFTLEPGASASALLADITA